MRRFKNLLRGMLFMAATICILCVNADALMVNAAEYSVTQAQAVLFTNENTVIRLDADENSAVMRPVWRKDFRYR